MDLTELVPSSNVRTTLGEISTKKVLAIGLIWLLSAFIWGTLALSAPVKAIAMSFVNAAGLLGIVTQVSLAVLVLIPIVTTLVAWRMHKRRVTKEIAPAVWLEIVAMTPASIHVKSYCGRTLTISRDQVIDCRAKDGTRFCWGYLKIAGPLQSPRVEICDISTER